MDATQAQRATVARRMFFPASGSTLTLTPAPGALTLAGAAPRLAATLRPATGAMTLGQGAAPSIGGEAVGTVMLLLLG
jgi:hypothetical protein